MFRLFIHRIVHAQSPRACMGGYLRPTIASRLSGWNGENANYQTSLTSMSIQRSLATTNFLQSDGVSTVAYKTDDSNTDKLALQRQVRAQITKLEQLFARYEEKCQRAERVIERDLVRTFDSLTRTVDKLESLNLMTDDVKVSLSLLLAILIRSCGRLMCDTPEKTRELLVGNIWQFIKEKNISVDISHYNSLIRALNENETNYDPQKLLEEIAAANLTPDRITYQRLIHQYCLQGDINGATSLLEKMKDLGMELNELIFASLIIGYSKQEAPPSVSEIFELMKSNGIEPSGPSYTAAMISQVRRLEKVPEAAKDLKNLLELVEREDIQFSLYDRIDLYINLMRHKDNEAVKEILRFIDNMPMFGLNMRYRITSALLKANEYEKASSLYFSKKPTTRALEAGNLGTYYIKLLASHKNVPVEHAMSECQKIKELGYNDKAFFHLYYIAAETGNLELCRASLKKIAEEAPLKCQYFWPLIAQAKNEEEVVNVLKSDLHPKMDTNELIETFSDWVWPQFSENIPRLFDLNKELHYDNNLLMASFLNFSVQNDKIIEAIKFVSEAPQDIVGTANRETNQEDENNADVETHDNNNKTFGGGQQNDRGNLIGRLLLQIAEQTKDPAMVNKAFNLCHISGQKVSPLTSMALVKVHLANEDFNSALEAMLKLAKEHRVTPCKRDLIQHCLEKKDPESLQKIMNVSTEIYGEGNSLFDLAISCLRLNKLKQAQKIFASPVFRVNPQRVYRTCRLLANEGNTNLLENFVHLSRDMYDVNQETLYQFLINAYERRPDGGKRALDLWNRMQEEEFMPGKKTLVMIAKVLERNNIQVPFHKPKLDHREID